MPTGYTAMIEEDNNTNAREYIEACSRAFGLFYHQRDESFDTPLRYPDGDVSYYAKALAEARQKYDAASSWTQDEIRKNHLKYLSDINDSNERSVNHAARINNNYEDVMAKLNKWQPVDEVSVNIKKFALDQINMCYPAKAYIEEPELSRQKWYKDHIEYMARQVSYYVKEVEKENSNHHDRRVSIDKFFADLENIPE